MQALRESQNRRSSLSNQPITAMSPGYNPGPMPPIGVIASSPHSQHGQQMPASSPAPPSEVVTKKPEPEPQTSKDLALRMESSEQATPKPHENTDLDTERRPSEFTITSDGLVSVPSCLCPLQQVQPRTTPALPTRRAVPLQVSPNDVLHIPIRQLSPCIS